MNNEFLEALAAGGAEPRAAARMELLADHMLEANRQMNLTRITEKADMARLHFLDSLTPLAAGLIPEHARVIDVGAGAGFPGLPLAIAREDIHLTLVEAAAKKAAFIEGAIGLLGLEARAVWGRAEELAREPIYDARFDVAVSRAVASLPMLLELCFRFVRVGGVLIAYKGAGAAQEAEAAAGAAAKLGLELLDIYTDVLPGTDHALVVYRRARPLANDAAYPRRFAKIKASPLF